MTDLNMYIEYNYQDGAKERRTIPQNKVILGKRKLDSKNFKVNSIVFITHM